GCRHSHEACWFASLASSQRPRPFADDATELPGAAGLDGSSIASRDPWCDTAGPGVDSRSAPGLGRVVAGDGRPFRPPFSPCGGFGRPSEGRSPAAGRELAARRTIKPSVIRALARSLISSDPFLRIVANLLDRGLTGGVRNLTRTFSPKRSEHLPVCREESRSYAPPSLGPGSYPRCCYLAKRSESVVGP